MRSGFSGEEEMEAGRDGKGEQLYAQKQLNLTSHSLPGIKLDLTAALPTRLHYKMFLRQHLACKLASRLCLLYSFYKLSGYDVGRMIIRQILPPSASLTIITHSKGELRGGWGRVRWGIVFCCRGGGCVSVPNEEIDRNRGCK